MLKQFFFISFLFCSIHLSGQYAYPVLVSTNTDIFDSPGRGIPADMDNDGDLDIVGSGISHQNVVCFENLDGNGNFADPYIIAGFSGSFGPKQILVEDLSGDGNLDVLLLKNNEILWYENDLQPRLFVGPKYFSDPPGVPQKIQIADLDGDGYLDVIVLSSYSEFGWFKSINGKGQFYSYQTLMTDLSSKSFNLADIDNDNDLDFIIARSTSHEVVWIENLDNSDGFGDPILIGIDENSSILIINDDLDGDEDIDIMTFKDLGNTINWFENTDGIGTAWETHSALDTTVSLSTPLLADFDDDDDLDMYVGINNRLFYYENAGTPSGFENPIRIFELCSNADDIQFGDINDDEIKDLIVTSNGAGGTEQLLVFKNKGGTNFENPVDIITDADNLKLLTSSDINNDGFPDLISGHSQYDKLTWQTFDNSPKRFKNPQIFPSSEGEPASVDFVDLDGDGDEDVISVLKEGGRDRVVWFEKINGEHNYQQEDTIYSDIYPIIYTKGVDFNGDDHTDVFFLKSGGDINGIYWSENLNGNADFADAIKINSDNTYFKIAIPTDLDHDGDHDVLVGFNGSYFAWFENTDGLGTFSDIQILFNIDGSIFDFHFEDIDNNGWKDIVYRMSQSIEIYKNLGGANFLPLTVIVPDEGFFTELDVIDYDIDGDLDFVCLTLEELRWYENLDGSGPNNLPKTIRGNFEELREFFFEDFDGDKDPDIIAYSYAKDKLYYLENYLDKVSLSGLSYFDVNANGNKDPGEFPVNLQSVEVQPDALLTFSTLR